jgi:hypothetical protein
MVVVVVEALFIALVLDKAPDVAADRPQAALPVNSTLTVYNYSIL